MPTVWQDTIALMLLGMGTVFVFLTLLVIGMFFMSTIINKIAPKEINATNKTQANQAEIAAVAAAAFATHRD